MKKPQDHLFQLIHSMSPAEKRYFRRHFASDNNVLTGLFDYLNNQTAYDEAAAKKYFGEKIARQFKVLKIQLSDLLLKSLVSHRYNKDPLDRIRNGMEEVSVLMEKGLNGMALQKLGRIKKIAEDYQEFTYLIEIEYLEFHLQHVHIDRLGMANNPFFIKVRESLAHLSHHIRLSELGHHLQDLIRLRCQSFTGEDQQYARELLTSPLMILPGQALSFRSRVTRNSVFSFLYMILGDEQKEFASKRSSVELFHAFPSMKTVFPLTYIGALRNYVNLALRLKEPGEITRAISEAKDFIAASNQVRSHLAHFYFAEVSLYNQQGDFGRVEKLEPEILRHLCRFDLEKDRIAAITYLNLLLANLALGKHARVQFFVRRLNDLGEDLEPYIEQATDILELINHFESGDREIIAPMANRKLRNLGTRPDWKGGLFEAFMAFFKELEKNPADQVAGADRFLADMPRWQEDPLYQSIRILRIDQWLEALKKHCTFAEIMRIRG